MAEENNFEAFAAELGLSQDGLIEKLKTYNNQLEGSKKISDRAIENMRANGISLRRRMTRDWLAGFVRMSRTTAQDHSFAETASLIKDLVERGANIDAPNVPAPDVIYEDVHAFGVGVTEFQTKNAQVEEARAKLSGHFIVARETTQHDSTDYYEEPLFIAPPEQTSWMLTHRNGIAKGFLVPSNGIFSLVLHHDHSTRGVGVISMMISMSDIDDYDLHMGLMLRLSDTQYRPSASRIVLRRATDNDLIHEWDAFVEAEEKASAKNVRQYVERLQDGHERQATYRKLKTGEFLKTPDIVNWPQMLREAGLEVDS